MRERESITRQMTEAPADVGASLSAGWFLDVATRQTSKLTLSKQPEPVTKQERVQSHMQEHHDTVLLNRAAQGDKVAFGELVNTHLSLCLSVAQRVLNNQSDAQDVAQDVFLKLWQVSDKLEVSEKGLKPWLARVAFNRAIDKKRTQKVSLDIDEVADIGEPARQHGTIEDSDRKARVNKALMQLPERQRLALWLFHYQGFSQHEVAEAMSASVDAVEALLARARRALRTDLEDEWRLLLNMEDR